MTLQQFLNQNIGKPLDFDGYFGDQCVDLVQFYNRDVVGGSFLVGSGAINFQDTYPTNLYDFIANTPTNSPVAGDIVLFKIGQYGHCAVVIAANVLKLLTFDQNWNSHPYCEAVLHDYIRDNVIGWLHPKKSVV